MTSDDERVENSPKPTTLMGMWDFGQCDPKRCSGRRLTRLRLIHEFTLSNSRFRGIILTPSASTTLSPADRSTILQHGLAVVDCSWAQLDSVPFHKLPRGAQHRLLPFCVAANTVNYGRALKLNCAEALMAGLMIASSGEDVLLADAGILADKFGYGQEFLRLNRDYFEAYRRCVNGQQVIEAQQRIISTSMVPSSASSSSSSSEYLSSDEEHETDRFGNIIPKSDAYDMQ